MNQYSKISDNDRKDLLENYLIEHFSVSAIRSFISNEKRFEKTYIFKVYDKTDSLASIIGRVYHNTLKEFFIHYRDTDQQMNYDLMTIFAHRELDRIPAHKYRPQVKKTILEMQLEAETRVNFLITTFLSEVDSYLDDIQEIIFVERMFKEFITLDGIDLPLPLKFIPDIVYVDKEGYLCAADHKGKKNYTKEEDVNMDCSNQSIAYSCGLKSVFEKEEYQDWIKKYPKIKLGVRNFNYFENKYTKNRDGTRQIKRITIDINESAKMFEAIFFDGVWRVLRAVQDPDYVYLMNQDDFFQNKGEMVDFWVKTRVEGLDGFPQLTPKQKRIMRMRKKNLRASSISKIPQAAITAYKKQTKFVSFNNENMSNLSQEDKIVHRLRCFNYLISVAHMIKGYSCDTYLIEVGAGMQTKKIHNYRLDIAHSLGVSDVRIAKNLVSYEGAPYVSLEVNKKKSRKFLSIAKKDINKSGYRLPIGRDNFDNHISWDIDNPSTPHMLVAGASGSGKSIALKTMVEAALKKGIKVFIIDPKFDFPEFNGRTTVINEQEDIEKFLEGKVAEMDGIYRSKAARGKQLIVFDEASDCFTRQTKSKKIETVVGEYKDGRKKTKMVKDEDFKTLEQNTLLLSQKARSAGIHLVLASQRFSVKVMTGDAKANFPARLCLTVASGVDAKVMLEEEGAEKLNGKGDALYRTPELSEPVRIQAYIFES